MSQDASTGPVLSGTGPVRSNLPGSAYSLVVEVVSENSLNGEYTDKMEWLAQRSIPQCWIMGQAPDGSDDDALVRMHRLESFAGKSTYRWERNLLLSELEAEMAINAALEMFIELWRQRRVRASDELRRMVADGEIDLDAIEKRSR